MKGVDEETGRAAEGILVAMVLGSAFWMAAYMLWYWSR
jgi:hypothetical protein